MVQETVIISTQLDDNNTHLLTMGRLPNHQITADVTSPEATAADNIC